jgi:putative MATE family efflux protein
MANQSHAANMTQGSIWKLMVRFAIPIFLGNLFQQFYNVADTFIVGNVLGTEAMAAVGSSGNLIFMLIGFFQGVFVGAGVVVSRFWGARDHENVSIAVHTSVAFAIVAGLVLTLIGVLLTPTILDWMHTPADVLPNSIEYFRVYFGGVIFAVLYNAVNGIFQAVGDSRHPLYFLIISAMLNVALDLLFVGVLGMGVGGAAFATVISQAVSAFLGLRKLMKATESYRLIPRKIRFNGRMLQKVLYIGIPSGLQNAVIALANVVVQTNINDFGALAQAGCGAYSKIEGFGFLPITSFTLALTTFIGQNLGAQEYERAKKGAVRTDCVCQHCRSDWSGDLRLHPGADCNVHPVGRCGAGAGGYPSGDDAREDNDAVLLPAGALQRNGGGSARRRTLDCADDCHAVLLVHVPRDVHHHCRADLAGTDDDFVGLPDYMGAVLHHLSDLLQRRGLGSRLWSEQTTQNDVILFPNSPAPSACAFSPLASAHST